MSCGGLSTVACVTPDGGLGRWDRYGPPGLEPHRVCFNPEREKGPNQRDNLQEAGNIMTETDPDDHSDDCEQCGLCCRIFGNSITPTVMNLYSWIEQGRKGYPPAFFCGKRGRQPGELRRSFPEDLGSVVLVEMRDPRTGGYPTVCPFLQRIQKRNTSAVSTR